MDRTKAPLREAPQDLPLLDIEPHAHIKGLPVFVAEGKDSEITRIEFIFNAGTKYEDIPILASVCNGMLKEGTSRMDSNEIADLQEYFGAKITTSISKDHASVSLVVLKRHLKELIPLYTSLFVDPSFPEEELESYIFRSRSALKVNLERVEIQCRMLFSQLFFGDSAYADRFDPGDYDRIDRTSVIKFFRKYYDLSEAQCYISGNGIDEAIGLLRGELENVFWKDRSDQKGDFQLNWEYRPSEKFKLKEGALQSAIRIGLPIPRRNHADFPAIFLLNTVLGGYFGSRLMQNLREDKGYTYGVSSSINPFEEAAYLVISTQVGAKHTDKAIDEIHKEITRLQREKVDVEELDLVKHFLTGNLLRNLDGPFQLSGAQKVLINSGLSANYYRDFVTTLFALEPEQLLEAANTYFNLNDFTSAIVGMRGN